MMYSEILALINEKLNPLIAEVKDLKEEVEKLKRTLHSIEGNKMGAKPAQKGMHNINTGMSHTV